MEEYGMGIQTKVLIADDEYIERRGLASLLARLSFPTQMFEAENGHDALTLLLCEKPKILLTDIRMPGTDGITLLHQAKAALPDLITVIITAYLLLAKWFGNKPYYRKYIVIPLSAIIAAIALYWTIKRTLF
jgi:CheY-like chemotaxis protein